MGDFCKWVTDEGIRFYLPNCMGGAVYGPDGCTCDRGRISIDEHISNATEYEKENRNLRTLIAKLEKRITELERGGGVYGPIDR